MNTFLKIIVGSIVVLMLFGIGFCTGYKTYPKRNPCPEADTITIDDSYWRNMADSLKNAPPKETIRWATITKTIKVKDWAWVDSVMTANEVDTAAIMKDFYTVKEYKWQKIDSGMLQVDLNTTVTQNKPISYSLDYKILEPRTETYITEDNTITYNKYLQAGFTVPMCFPDVTKHLNETTLDLIYVFPKGYIGAGYQGLFNYKQDYLLVKGGITLFKFQKRK